MVVPPIRAITNVEFVQMMGKCRPPTGWPSTIAVANSAGPDSTCLLFLLRRMIDWKHNNNQGQGPTASLDLPDSMISLHVDHNLQSDAEKMARAARAAATRSNAAAHAALRIPWGTRPFPPRPRAELVESVARTARYRLMFDAMKRDRGRGRERGVRVLATGHHADDQVETVLMRLGAGSSVLGLGGMRPVRRFGMALGKCGSGGGAGEGEGESESGEGESYYGWFGFEGLDRWIVRPLLDVSKDRILATCDLNGVDYVVDRTNFQPDLTLRNAVRHVLDSNEKRRHFAEFVESAPLPPGLARKMIRIKTASEHMKVPIPIDLMANRESLYAAVDWSSQNLTDTESKVSAHLNRFSILSPPGTFMLATDESSATTTDPLVQLSTVLRVLRYVSPHPWGSTRAQAGRRHERLQRIVQRVWDPDPDSEARKRFEAGANVLWTPLRICRGGKLKYERPKPGERFGWLASRSPLQRSSKADFDRDISTELLPPRQRAEVLYDNRFLVTFRLEAVQPDDPVMASIIRGSGRVMLVLGGSWLWPQVVWRKGEDDVVIAHISTPERRWWRGTHIPSRVQKVQPLWQNIVDFEFIRVLEDP